MVAGAISHYLLAQRVLKEYQKSGGAPVCNSAFFWGAQGPDFLFYDFPPLGKRQGLAALGSRMHKGDPALLFSAMRKYCIGRPRDDAARSYLLGFLCHYSLDRNVHPYVYAKIRQLKQIYPERPGVFLHSQIETALDNVTLRYENGDLPTSFNLKTTVPKDPQIQERIAAFYAYIFRTVYQRQEKQSSILAAMRNCRFVDGLQNDRTGYKKMIFQKLEGHFHKYYISCFFHGLMENDDYDYANVSGDSWMWPPSAPRIHTETYLELYRRSAEESMAFISRIFSVTHNDAFTDHIPFS